MMQGTDFDMAQRNRFNVATTSAIPNVTSGDSMHYEDLPYPDFTQIGAVRITFIVVYVAVMILALTGNAMVCYTGK